MNPENNANAAPDNCDIFTGEKEIFEDSQHALLNILEDFADEKKIYEDAQRAMLNLLEDFDVEKSKTEAANKELLGSIDSLRIAKEATDIANREIESFSYSVSHDLRAPLRSVSGFSQLLLEDYSEKLDDEGRDYLNRIVAATKKMGFLIDDLLKLSRVSRAALEHSDVDLGGIAGKIAIRLNSENPDRKVEFKVNGNPTTSGDEHLLTVMLENLIGNAWKFTEKREKAIIEFGVERRGEERIFFIKDNGAGFDNTYIDKLFKPFQRLHKTEKFSGTGIGLATVKRIVERHSGRVWIEGESGKGATVFFTL